MKNKGFTLVELLAVIAILAILVIMALPAVLKMYSKARIDSFSNEVNTVAKTARQQYLLDGGKVKRYTNAEGSTNKLSLTGNSKLKYYVEMNDQGKIIKLQVTNGDYQYNISDSNGINVADSEDVDIVSELDEKDILVINSLPTDESYFTYSPTGRNVTYDIDIPTCISYVSSEFPKYDAEEYCNNEIESFLLHDDISERDYASYGLSNVVFSGTAAITGYNSSIQSITYDIDINTCKNYLINELGYEEQDAADDCSRDSEYLKNELRYGLSPSHYADYGLSNVNIVTTGPKDVKIPSTINGLTINEIRGYAFEFRGLTSVVIPDTVEIIDYGSFMGNQINSLVLGKGVKKIRYNAFSSNALTSVTIPSSVRILEGETCWHQGNHMTCAMGAFTGNQIASVTIEGKSSSNDFDTYTDNIWGWDSNVTCVKDNTSNISNGCIIWNGSN